MQSKSKTATDQSSQKTGVINSIKHSPWGTVDHQKDYGPGLSFVSTPSHGGLRLSTERWQELQSEFPGFKPFAGEPWLEEDCDYTLAVLLWPELFNVDGAETDAALFSAVRFARTWTDEPMVQAWLLASPRGRAVNARADFFLHQHYLAWEYNGMSTSGKGWQVRYRRLGDGATRTLHLKDYPPHGLLTEEQLNALPLA